MPQIEIANTGVTNGDGYFTYPSFHESLLPGVPHFVLGTNDILRLRYYLSGLSPFPFYFDNGWVRLQLPLDTIDTVNSCYLKLRLAFALNIPADKVCKLWVRAHLDLNSNGPADRDEAEDQATTNGTVAAVEWIIEGNYAQGEWLISPDISSVIRELLDQGSWAADNYITLYILLDSTENTSQQVIYVITQYALSFVPPYLNTVDSLPRIVLDYTDGIPGPTPYDKAVEHTIDFMQEITWSNTGRNLEHEITFVQDIDYVRTYNRTVEHVLTINQDFTYANQYEYTVEHALAITHSISYVKVYNRTVEHTIDIDQYILRDGPLDRQFVHFESEFDIDQDISYVRTMYRTVEHELTIEQYHTVTPQFRNVEHALFINQNISYEGSVLTNPRTLESELEIDHDVDWSINTGRTVEHELTIQQFFFGYKNNDDVNYGEYYQGTGVDTISPVTPRPSEPTLSSTQQMILEWPIVSPTEDVTLRRPLFGNQEILDIQRIQRPNRGGELITFRDSTWPIVHRTKYQFDGVDDVTAAAVRAFFRTTLGLEIKMTDYEGVIWHGFVINPSGVFSDQDNTDCDNSAEFEFDGVRQ